jgi:hypothetical protein
VIPFVDVGDVDAVWDRRVRIAPALGRVEEGRARLA